MRINITEKDIRHFKDEQGIECEGLLTTAKFENLKETLLSFASSHNADEMEDNARDLYRLFPEVRSILSNPTLISFFSQLAGLKAFRYVFDQVIFPAKETTNKTFALYQEEAPLSNVVCYQGLEYAMVICIESSEKALPFPFPSEPGSICFFPVSRAISLQELVGADSGLYFLVGFGGNIVLYRDEPKDSYRYGPKKQGLSYGDKLSNKDYPLIFAKT